MIGVGGLVVLGIVILFMHVARSRHSTVIPPEQETGSIDDGKSLDSKEEEKDKERIDQKGVNKNQEIDKKTRENAHVTYQRLLRRHEIEEKDSSFKRLYHQLHQAEHGYLTVKKPLAKTISTTRTYPRLTTVPAHLGPWISVWFCQDDSVDVLSNYGSEWYVDHKSVDTVQTTKLHRPEWIRWCNAFDPKRVESFLTSAQLEDDGRFIMIAPNYHENELLLLPLGRYLHGRWPARITSIALTLKTIYICGTVFDADFQDDRSYLVAFDYNLADLSRSIIPKWWIPNIHQVCYHEPTNRLFLGLWNEDSRWNKTRMMYGNGMYEIDLNEDKSKTILNPTIESLCEAAPKMKQVLKLDFPGVMATSDTHVFVSCSYERNQILVFDMAQKRTVDMFIVDHEETRPFPTMYGFGFPPPISLVISSMRYSKSRNSLVVIIQSGHTSQVHLYDMNHLVPSICTKCRQEDPECFFCQLRESR